MERAKAINILEEYCGKRDILAEAIQNEVAKKYIIVGGAGHTTETLRNVAGATDYFRKFRYFICNKER